MHLLESFALSSGKKIDKIQILEKFYPVPFDKYILLQPFSKDSKNYDYWEEVIFLIFPFLKERGIHIVQVGGANEKPLMGCYHLQGKTRINETAFLIKNSLLFFGADSFGTHLAGHYDIPLVALYSNNYKECVRPYFGNIRKQILLEPDRPNDEKPSFSYQENPKTINRIKPETIANAILQLLGVEEKIKFKTLHFGQFYTQPRFIEMVPDIAINTQNLNLDTIIVRMDFEYNENVLLNQLRISNCSIVTDKPIKREILDTFKSRLKQIIYIITEDNDPDFAMYLHKSGINYALISYLPSEVLDRYKLAYLDTGIIHRRENYRSIQDTPVKDVDPKKLFYKTNKTTLAKQKIFPSRAALEQNHSIETIHQNFEPIIDTPSFWSELDFMMLVEVLD